MKGFFWGEMKNSKSKIKSQKFLIEIRGGRKGKGGKSVFKGFTFGLILN
jgi:hypothetical protein